MCGAAIKFFVGFNFMTVRAFLCLINKISKNVSDITFLNAAIIFYEITVFVFNYSGYYASCHSYIRNCRNRLVWLVFISNLVSVYI